MKKSSMYFPIACLCLGAIFAIGAIVFLIADLVQNSLMLIPTVMYLLILLGGVVLALQSWQSLRNKKSDDSAKKRADAMDRLGSGKALRSKSIATLILTTAACIFLFFYSIAQNVDLAPKSNSLEYLSYDTADVLEIVSENYRGSQIWEDRPEGEQILNIEITSGKHEGKIFRNVQHNLSVFKGTALEVGDSIIVSISDDGESVEFQGINSFNRITPVLVIILLFILVTVLVGGKVGAKSLLGLGLTILCVFTVLYPLLFGGWPTLPTILGMCAFVTIVEFVIIGGVDRKTICAILGTISGVAIAMLFGQFAVSLLRMSTYEIYESVGEVEALAQYRNLPMQEIDSAIKVNDLLVGGILIAALGAVNDVAMSISSAMNELVAVNPNLTRKELFKSGMNIGRDMVGTMTNTLILALVGGSFIEILYYTSQDITFYELMAKPYFPMEIMQAVASSIGVILAVPLSVILGMVFFHGKKK